MEEDDMATFEHMIAMVKAKYEEKRQQVRTEIMSEHAKSIDSIEDKMHAQFALLKSTASRTHQSRMERVQMLQREKAGIQVEIEAIMERIKEEVGGVSEYLRHVQESIVTASSHGMKI